MARSLPAEFVVALIGTYVRAHVDELVLFLAARERDEDKRMLFMTVLLHWKKPVLQARLVNMVHSSFNYMSTAFGLGYAVKTLAMPQSSITFGVTVANIVEMCAVPLIAAFSDRVGRRPFIMLGIVLAALWYPVFFQILLTKNALAIMGRIRGVDRTAPCPDVCSRGGLHGRAVSDPRARERKFAPRKQLGIALGGGLALLIGAALMGSG